MLLVTPISETHYFILLLLPLMALLAVAVDDPNDTTRQIIRLTLVAFSALVLASAGIRQLKVVGAPCWGILMVWVVLLVVVILRKNNSGIGARDRT